MVKKANISSSELKVLEILWASSPLTSSQIVAALSKSSSWHHRTIKTLINRLEKKKAIGHKDVGQCYLYYPLLKKDEYLQTTSNSIIKRLFGGRISPFVAQFARVEKLTKDDIEDLKKIIDELDQ